MPKPDDDGEIFARGTWPIIQAIFQTHGSLTRTEGLVLGNLLMNVLSDGKGNSIKKTLWSMQRATGLSRVTLIKALRGLQEKGLMAIDVGIGSEANTYRLHTSSILDWAYDQMAAHKVAHLKTPMGY